MKAACKWFQGPFMLCSALSTARCSVWTVCIMLLGSCGTALQLSWSYYTATPYVGHQGLPSVVHQICLHVIQAVGGSPSEPHHEEPMEFCRWCGAYTASFGSTARGYYQASCNNNLAVIVRYVQMYNPNSWHYFSWNRFCWQSMHTTYAMAWYRCMRVRQSSHGCSQTFHTEVEFYKGMPFYKILDFYCKNKTIVLRWKPLLVQCLWKSISLNHSFSFVIGLS